LPLKGRRGRDFTKASTRTRVSFEVGIGNGRTSLYLSQNDIQMGRGETVADTRGRCRVRAWRRDSHVAQSDIETFARVARSQSINALTTTNIRARFWPTC